MASTLELESKNAQSASFPRGVAIYQSSVPSSPRTLLDILKASTTDYPNAIAIDNGKERINYAELAQVVTNRAGDLRAAGVGVGDRVGVRVSSGSLELYISILAVLTAGAAYVPVDVDDPDERAQLVWNEAGVCATISDEATLTILKTTTDSDKQNRRLSPGDDAWVIFTSGSTGKPKGVAVSHCSAAAFVDAEAILFSPNTPLGPGDRVLACLSVAFDASCEEMWLAWRHGACLVPAPRSLVKAGSDLGVFLRAQRITVVSTVPTLAALWPTDTLRGLRLLILGGEACPQELANRLTNAVRSVWNTYGPTETTVVACAAPIVAGEAIRIGLPLAGWKLAVVKPDGQPVHWGEEGELIIGGVGTARYLDADIDKAKFVSSPCFDAERVYFTGDLVRAEKEGLFFIGRNDEQIKLGGRRIELGEIDAALMTLPGVSGAASAVKRSEVGNEVLVGYIVRTQATEACSDAYLHDRELLLRFLPPALVPMLVTVDNLPVRISGKIDRKALPWPPPPASTRADGRQTLNSTATWLASIWQRVLGVSPAALDSDFFHLGGASLAAAQLVSILRERCPTMSVADIYECPTLGLMADLVDKLAATNEDERLVKPTAKRVMLIQFCILFAELTFGGFRWVAILAFTKKLYASRLGPGSWADAHDLPWWLIIILWVVFVTFLGRMLAAAGVVRILTIGIRPGVYSRGGATHLRLWGAERFIDLMAINSLVGTPWACIYARLVGCHVGHDAQLHALPPVTGLASFGDGCVIEPETDVAGWWIDGDRVHIGTVTIGQEARVGRRTILMPNAIVEAYASVMPGTSVHGKIKSPDLFVSHDEKYSNAGRGETLSSIRYTFTILLLDFLQIIPFAPVYALTSTIVKDYRDFQQLMLGLLKMMVPGTALGLLLYALCVIILVRSVGYAIRPGEYSWHSSTAWAAWLTHFLMTNARVTLFPLYSSLLTPSWLRLLGATIGRRVEASTVISVPSLLNVQDYAFLADDVLLSPIEYERGCVRVGTVSVGTKAFVGNSGIVASDTHVPNGSLVAVLSTSTSHMEANSSWLGRPPTLLPRRHVEVDVDDAYIFEPPTKLVLLRGLVESFRIVPLLISGILTTCIGNGLLYLLTYHGFGWAVLASGGLLASTGVVAGAITTAAKWVLTPVIRPGMQRPLWSSFVWRNELADSFVQSLAVPWLVTMCYGTPLLSWWMSTLGAKIGPGVWLESHLLPEAELCELESGATINRRALLQTHLFHDRIMRLDKVHLKAGATLGPNAISLPGTTIGSGTTIGPISLVMRGEQLPSSTRWIGNPIRPWAADEVPREDSSIEGYKV